MLISSDATALPSTVSFIVDSLIPESSSVTLKAIAGVALVINAPDVGYVMADTGATFSFTTSCRDFPSVPSDASFVVVLPASSVALTVTG